MLDAAGKIVLIVEDDDAYRMVLAEFLRQFRLIILQARNGQEAFSVLAKNKVDIVITDLVMPVMDGVTFISGLRASPSAVPIIAISGSSRTPGGPTLDMAMAAGATTTMHKPFRFLDLAETITALLAEDRRP